MKFGRKLGFSKEYTNLTREKETVSIFGLHLLKAQYKFEGMYDCNIVLGYPSWRAHMRPHQLKLIDF